MLRTPSIYVNHVSRNVGFKVMAYMLSSVLWINAAHIRKKTFTDFAREAFECGPRKCGGIRTVTRSDLFHYERTQETRAQRIEIHKGKPDIETDTWNPLSATRTGMS